MYAIVIMKPTRPQGCQRMPSEEHPPQFPRNSSKDNGGIYSVPTVWIPQG